MATWKKLVVSGSDISQLNNDAGYISASQVPGAHPSYATASINGVELLADSPSGSFTFNTASGEAAINLAGNAGTDTIEINLIDGGIANAKLEKSSLMIGEQSVSLGATGSVFSGLEASGSFSGSFNGALVDGTTATTQSPGDNSTKVATTAYVDAQVTAGFLGVSGSGATNTQVDLDSQALTFTGANGIEASASAQTMTIGIGSGSIANSRLVNDNITIGNATVELGGSTTLAATGFNSGSFSGSFEGDGSGLTGIATNLDVSGSDGTGLSIDLKTQDLTIGGTANEIETTVAGTTVTIGLPDDVTITQDLTVNRNLTVVGTASFQHETNLEVSDRFIRMASGSSAAGDGGIVIQQSADGTGEVFGFENSVSRWAVSSSFDGSDSTFNAEAYMAAVLEGSADTATAIASAVPDSKYNAKGNIWISDSENIWIYS